MPHGVSVCLGAAALHAPRQVCGRRQDFDVLGSRLWPNRKTARGERVLGAVLGTVDHRNMDFGFLDGLLVGGVALEQVAFEDGSRLGRASAAVPMKRPRAQRLGNRQPVLEAHDNVFVFHRAWLVDAREHPHRREAPRVRDVPPRCQRVPCHHGNLSWTMAKAALKHEGCVVFLQRVAVPLELRQALHLPVA
eukprot:4168406-Pyramimonas_sp.AAC.1